MWVGIPSFGCLIPQKYPRWVNTERFSDHVWAGLEPVTFSTAVKRSNHSTIVPLHNMPLNFGQAYQHYYRAIFSFFLFFFSKTFNMDMLHDHYSENAFCPSFLLRNARWASIHFKTITCRPRCLRWMRRPTGDQEVAGSPPATVGNILSWRLIIKYFLRSFSPFRWFKKGSCQFLAKECAQYWLTA